MKKLLKVIIAGLLALSFCSNAAKMTVIENKNIKFLKFEGEIVEGDAVKLNRIIERWKGRGEPVDAIAFNSPGGDIQESYDMIDIIIENEMVTIVPPKAECVSACVGMFAAGTERILYPKSKVGVHRINVDDEDTDFARSASVDMMEVYKDLEIPASIRLKMIETPPDEVYFLNVKEKEEFSTEKSAFSKARSLAQKDKDFLKLSTQPQKQTPSKPELEYTLKPDPVGVSATIHEPKPETAKVKELREAGWYYLNNRSYTEAEMMYSQILKIDPENTSALTAMGDVKINTNKVEEAKQYLVRSLELSRKQPMAWRDLGFYYVYKQDVSLATDCFVQQWATAGKAKKDVIEMLKSWEKENPGTVWGVASGYALKQIQTLPQ